MTRWACSDCNGLGSKIEEVQGEGGPRVVIINCKSCGGKGYFESPPS